MKKVTGVTGFSAKHRKIKIPRVWEKWCFSCDFFNNILFSTGNRGLKQ